jgi:hypothetical protein
MAAVFRKCLVSDACHMIATHVLSYYLYVLTALNPELIFFYLLLTQYAKDQRLGIEARHI